MLAYLDASRFCSCICGDCVLCENAATRERRRIVLIKITTQLRAHWETWNKAEIACLFSPCRLNSSKFPMSSSLLFVHILHLSSSLSHTLSLVFFVVVFFLTHHLFARIVIWHSKPPSFLPFWIIEIHLFFKTTREIPSHFLPRPWGESDCQTRESANTVVEEVACAKLSPEVPWLSHDNDSIADT